MKKERAIRIGILSVVFVLAIIIFSYITNRGNGSMTADMGAATLPIISFEVGGQDVNTLAGHVREMNAVAMRDTIVTLQQDGTLTANLHYGEGETSLKYEVCTLDGGRVLYENTAMFKDGTAKLEFGNVLKQGEEGILKLIVSREQGDIYYYTRVSYENEYHTSECLAYAVGLHKDILANENTADIQKVMEPNTQGDNTTLQHVTIHSDMAHVLWGDLKPALVGEASVEIKETNKAYTSVLMRYQIRCAGDNNEEELYNVKEFFKVSYGTKRRYLIEYDRTMEEVFDTSNVTLSAKGVILGIADKDISYKTNEKGTLVSFIQAGELWNYNKEEDSFSLVFSFSDSETEDIRNQTDKHNIKILSMEDDGNMTFSVCGYMNRGIHEGESGIAVYYYNQSQNGVEEKAFIPSTESPLVIEEELNELAYYSKDQNVLYVMANGTLVKVDMKEKERTVLMEGLSQDQYVASDDGHLLAYHKTVDGKTVTEIWDFEKDTKRELSAEEGQLIVPLGFLAEDFVYGISMESDAGYDESGTPVQAMHRVEIQNVQGEVVKTYEESEVYTLGVMIENNMITLNQGVKDGNRYRKISEDYITNNETSANKAISLDSYWTDLKETQYRFVFAEGIQDKKAKSLKPKLVLQERSTDLDFEDENAPYFYVYGHGEQAGIFAQAGDAVSLADELSGVVVSPSGNCVWEDGNKVSWYRNFKITGFSTKDGESTLAACVRRVLSYEGKSVDVAKELKDQSAEQVIGEYLDMEAVCFREISVKQMCYLIDKGTPVIAMKDKSSAILLVGYDAKTVTYIDPSNGGTYTSTFEKVNEMTKGSGNTFVGYVE